MAIRGGCQILYEEVYLMGQYLAMNLYHNFLFIVPLILAITQSRGHAYHPFHTTSLSLFIDSQHSLALSSNLLPITPFKILQLCNIISFTIYIV